MMIPRERRKKHQANATASFYESHFVKIQLWLLLLAFILLYWESFAYWVHTWLTDFNYHSGFILPLLSFYIVWRRRALLGVTPVEPSKTGLLLIIVGLLFYVGGQVAYTKTAQQLSFFIILPGFVLYYFGWRVLRQLAIPLAILVFMAPYAEFFYFHIQVFVARICVTILLFLGAPVHLEAISIHLPNVSVQIVAGCSGIRFMTAILPLGLTIACVSLEPLWKKVSLAVFSAVLPVLANIFRVVSILIFALKGMEVFVYGIPHIIYGYLVFLGALFTLFSVAILLMRLRVEPSPPAKEMPESQNGLSHSWKKGFSSHRNLVLIAVMLLIPLLVHARLTTQRAEPLLQTFKSFPFVLGQWKGREIGVHEWHPEIIGATDNLRRLYRDREGNVIKVFVSYLPTQTQGRELVFHANKIIPPGFRIVSDNIKTWNINPNAFPYNLKARSSQITNGIKDETLLRWYQNTSHFHCNKFMAKALMAMDSLVQNRSYGAFFVLRVKASFRNADYQDIKVQNFLNHFMDELPAYIPS
jgi:EpsI family protein